MASTYIYRDIGTPTNAYKGTVSHWIKKSIIGASETEYGTFAAWLNGGNTTRTHLNFYNNTIYFYSQQHSMLLQTNRVFRDPNAWYHIVVAWDTTQSTASNRVKIYVNGVQETSFSTANYPAQNAVLECNTSGRRFGVGTLANGSGVAYGFWDGSISHFHFIDGTAYDATAFGEYDANGVWKINTSPSVTYGTNGFFILKDGNSVTDQSGNTNNLTVGGGTLTKTEDSPSNVFATLNPLRSIGGNIGTYSTGNTTYTAAYNDWQGTVGTLGATSGKWYWEWKVLSTNNNISGIVSDIAGANAAVHDAASVVGGFGGYIDSGNFHARFAESDISGWDTASVGVSFTTNDIVNVALDMDNKFLYFGKNGTWMKSGNPTSGATGTGGIDIGTPYDTVGLFAMPAVSIYASGASGSINFGNGYFGTTAVSSAGTNASGIGIFEHDVPTGFTSLSTKGLNL